MKQIIALGASIAAVVSFSAANAQAPVAQAEQASIVARSLPGSTMMTVASDSEISSKHVKVGDRFTFTVINDIIENGSVAIPRGSKVEAAVSWKTGKAVGGKSGKFELIFDKVNVRGHNYAVRGTHRQEGKGNTVAAVFATLLISGRSAVMLPGQTVNIFTVDTIPY